MAREPLRIEPGSNAFFDAGARAEEDAIGVASFLLSLRARGIRDTAVLRAMELVPREIFAPRRFTDLARKDVALPLPCGQTMTAPRTVAKVVFCSPVTMIDATIAIAEIALVSDISGVCSSRETFWIT